MEQLRIIPKTQAGCRGDFAAAAEAARYKQILLTVGDLVFTPGEIAAFTSQAQLLPEKLVLALDRTRLTALKLPTIIDLRMVLAFLPRDLLSDLVDINPKSFFAVESSSATSVQIA